MRSLLPDVRFAFRTFGRSPLFAIVAILSLALGIGANTAIFTLMDQLMLRQLPIKDPDQLVMLFQRGPHAGSNMGDRMHSYPIYQDYQQKAAPLSEVIARRLVSTSISVENQTERVLTELVSGNYFTMLGVKPAVGRLFTSEEHDRTYAGHPVVTLSYDYWATRFAGDPNVIGKKILVNKFPMTIIGVSAPGFSGIDPAQSPQIRVPILMMRSVIPEWEWVKIEDRRTRWIQVFARLKPGFTAESAKAPMQVLFRQIREHESTLPAAKDWTKFQRDRFMTGTLNIEAAATGYSQLRNSFSKALVVLMSMVGLVLLIACANVANLLIARAFARQKEIAVRLSIGASRGQLVRQLLVESMILSAFGGIAGIAVAFALTRGLLALIPFGGSPLLIRAEPDARVLLFTLGVTILTGFVFGLVPALRASRPDLWSTLKDTAGAITGSGGSILARKGLVAAQVALSFLLLFGAGLFVRSLQNLKTTETGFKDLDNIISFQVSPALSNYDDERASAFYQQLLDQIRSAPGVKSAGVAAASLLAGDEWDSTMSVEGHKATDGEDMQAFMNALSPGYFETMGIPLLEGRDFDRRDIRHIPDGQPGVAIVNQKFARHFFGDKSPIGRHLGWGDGPKTKLNIEIIGVVGDSLFEGPREGVHRQVFMPKWGKGTGVFYVRSQLDSKQTYDILRNEVRKLDAAMPVYEMKTLGAQLDETLLSDRLIALLSAGFGFLATMLAAIGLYGVMAFVVSRRSKELGIRMALGAAQSSVIWIVMREVLTLVGLGLAIGVPAAFAVSRYVSSQLYGVKASDPWVASISLVMLAGVAALAGFIPARRASRIDPILVLRYD